MFTSIMSNNPILQRWLRFNSVGAMGMVLQLGLIALLTRASVHYQIATAIAVEAAVLHNFVWHERWTYRARIAATEGGALGRLARFHGANGAISIGGNLVLMYIYTGLLGITPVLANLLAIATCSLLNFASSDSWVFATSRREG